MAAGTVQLYDATAKFLQGGADLTTNTIKCALVTSSYTPNQDTDDAWADVSANEIAGAHGYTTGGATVTTPVLTEITKGFRFDSDDVSWTASGSGIAAWRYAVFYISGTVEGITNPLLGYFVGDDTPANIPVTTAGVTLKLECPAAGWWDMTRP
jgi:hypothetical protein